MSGAGGDTGGGGDESGGAGKGGGGDGGGSGGNMADYSYTPSSGGGDPSGGTSSFASTGGGTGSLDGFVNDPSQGNLTGPGPATGSPATGGNGSPGEGSGFSFDNSSYLSGLDQYAGSPISAGGTSSVFDTGTSGVPNLPSSGQSAFETATGSAGAAPAGASALSVAAPTGVAGNPDAASSTDLSSSNRKSAGGAGTGNSGSSGGILDSIGIGKGNMASSLVAGAGLLNNLVNGKTAPAQSANLNANASFAGDTAKQQTSAGQALQQWQTTGTLPDSYESQVQRAAQDAKTRAVSNAAAQGLPTDPTQNTALAQQLNAIDAAIPNQREQIASQLAQSGQQMVNAGLQATGISSGVYQTLANLENEQNKARGAAIANFAGALNGGSNKGLTLKVA